MVVVVVAAVAAAPAAVVVVVERERENVCVSIFRRGPDSTLPWRHGAGHTTGRSKTTTLSAEQNFGISC